MKKIVLDFRLGTFSQHLCTVVVGDSLSPNSQVLLADVAGRGSLPESAVSLEALRSEVTMEELHDQLAQHGALVVHQKGRLIMVS